MLAKFYDIYIEAVSYINSLGTSEPAALRLKTPKKTSEELRLQLLQKIETLRFSLEEKKSLAELISSETQDLSDRPIAVHSDNARKISLDYAAKFSWKEYKSSLFFVA